ncbi:hypothetical protein OOZ19_12630 [Saccharopolyspora sp. NFXS83]|uniref:hypothetical protein n=1 Tax=Saccharopolyspora sp. NFXS83 TaxID=2993560 RepID=UPI00224A4C2F|nr:hypothetical protein [Saccharopolyspora sp. NFXS83]MCX2731089.1 hypothetical protein [Saccharopolyspora sp. NFXS83]
MAAFVLAGAMVAAGGGGSAALSGTAPTGATDPAAARNVSARKADGKKAARKGQPEEAWRRMGLRQLKRQGEHAVECASRSFGQVRKYFLRTPCRSMDRVLFGVVDGNGSIAVVSVVWVTMGTRSQSREFRNLIDVHGTGDVTPLAGSALGLGGVEFTGWHYDSRPTKSTMVIAEAETASGHLSDSMLDATAEVATYLPRP